MADKTKIDDNTEMNDKSEVDKAYDLYLEKKIDRGMDARRYAVARFDIIVITLAGSAIGWSLKLWEDLPNDHCTVIITWPIMLALVLFLITIFANLGSQIFSYYANRATSDRDQDTLAKRTLGTKISDLEQRLRLKKSTCLNKWVVKCNMASLATLLFGMIFVGWFAKLNF